MQTPPLPLQLAERALMIWPSKRLKSGTRYIVALRYLEDESERPIQPSPGFIALRYAWCVVMGIIYICQMLSYSIHSFHG